MNRPADEWEGDRIVERHQGPLEVRNPGCKVNPCSAFLIRFTVAVSLRLSFSTDLP